ncbi:MULTISPECIES: DUF465 domain-containing protein [unclassified Pseudoalteromonas]|uniref:YdcH family protein n=1 Tax=unclassified Pseudoalteromonas TaxID=194690 RepID=UPI0009E58B7D
MDNAHFYRLFKDYHELDHEVIRIEEGVENTSDQYLDNLKLKRLALKHELYTMLKQHAS